VETCSGSRPVRGSEQSTKKARPSPEARFGGATHAYGSCGIEYIERPNKDFIKEAADAATGADVDVSLNAQGGLDDRQTIYLPKDGHQDRLIAGLLATFSGRFEDSRPTANGPVTAAAAA